MALYVSRPFRVKDNPDIYPVARWCYLFADTFVELEYHAQLFGLSQKWSYGNYYLLAPNLRAIAIEKGAKEVDNYTANCLKKKPLPHDPAEAKLPKYR